MKIPRWLLSSLNGSVVLVVLVSAACWWITWPERTLRSFCDAVINGEFERAAEFGAVRRPKPNSDEIRLVIAVENSHDVLTGKLQSLFPPSSLLPLQPRSRSDLFRGRACYRVSSMGLAWPVFSHPSYYYEFTAERGKISVKYEMEEF